MSRYLALCCGLAALLCADPAVHAQDCLSACLDTSGHRGSRYPHGEEAIGTIRQVYDGALTPTLAVSTFRNIDRLFPTRIIRRGPKVHPLPVASRALRQVEFASRGKTWDLFDYLALNRVAGLLVLKDGRIALEQYEYGNTQETRWMSMSVAKSITSTLLGAALADGHIKSLDDRVVRYVPRLAGSAYDGVSVRDALMMASGVRWNETYTDPGSDRRQMLEAQIAQRPGAVLDLIAKLPRAAQPGTVNHYSTGETQVLGEIVRGAARRALAQYLSERIWAKFGMQSDATWWLDSPDGMEIAGSGISATLRDYGRFGLFFLNGGLADGERILPAGWTEEASTPKSLFDGKRMDYGYSWWPLESPGSAPGEGAFLAGGIFGQSIYINPQERVVIVVWGAQSKPNGVEVIDDRDFFAAVVKALAGS